MAQPKLHHTVPQFYLRRFAVDDRVVLVEKRTLTESKLRPKPRTRQVLGQTHFYSVDMPDGSKDATFECLLSQHVEGPGARALERLIDKRLSLTFPRLRRDLSILLAFQFIRGESVRSTQSEFMKALIRQNNALVTPEMLQRFFRETEGVEYSEKEMRELAEFAHDPTRYEITIEHEDAMHVDLMLKHALQLVPFFQRRVWKVVEFGEPVLLTGDEPIALIGDAPESGVVGGLGLAKQIVFPLDPWRALVMLDPRTTEAQRWTYGNTADARIINRHVAFACHKYIVHRPGTNPLEGLDVPEKAPPVGTLGNYTFMQRNRAASKKPRLR